MSLLVGIRDHAVIHVSALIAGLIIGAAIIVVSLTRYCPGCGRGGQSPHHRAHCQASGYTTISGAMVGAPTPGGSHHMGSPDVAFPTINASLRTPGIGSSLWSSGSHAAIGASCGLATPGRPGILTSPWAFRYGTSPWAFGIAAAPAKAAAAKAAGTMITAEATSGLGLRAEEGQTH